MSLRRETVSLDAPGSDLPGVASVSICGFTLINYRAVQGIDKLDLTFVVILMVMLLVVIGYDQ